MATESGISVKRGQLRIYLGYAPGVGTTSALLSEGLGRAERGADVVVACARARGRRHPTALLARHEVIPLAKVAYRGVVADEMDLGAVLARRPQVALVDELAHSNLPGSRHETRWQNAEDLLAAGIDVISSVAIRDLASLADVAEKITRAPQGQTIPDPVVREADEIELVDITPEALRDRMARGQICPPDQAEAALADSFRIGNLSALRELATLWLAVTLAADPLRYQIGGRVHRGGVGRERVTVALDGGPEGQILIRRAARIAARSGGDPLPVHAARSGARAHLAGLATQRRLVESVGGTYRPLTGDDTATALLTFAHAESATQLVFGAGAPCWPSSGREPRSDRG
jgi:two-component system sensor histidine kinase KdpD